MVTLINPTTGRLQFEQFLSHFAQWNDNYFMLTAVRASEALKQEWLHEQIASSTELVVAKQADATMINPDAAAMLAFLHRQRNHLHERQTLKKAARGTGERVMRITQRPRSDDDEQPTAATAVRMLLVEDTEDGINPSKRTLATMRTSGQAACPELWRTCRRRDCGKDFQGGRKDSCTHCGWRQRG
jgi:hypothetical protein